MRKTQYTLLLTLCVLSFFILIISPLALKAQTPLSGNQNGILLKANSPYVLTGNITVPAGQTLTIEPGCRILMPYYGNFNINGTLIANGTVTDSIYFYGQKQSVYNYGGYLNFTSFSDNSSLSYVSIDSLGLNGYSILGSSSFSLANSTIKNTSSSYSILLNSDTISPVIQNCVFSGNEASRTVYAPAGSISNITNNTNAIISAYGSVNQNRQWQKAGLNSYYRVNSNVTIDVGKTLTIQPGCKVNMPYTGYFTVNGTLLANGTATDSIYFYGEKQSVYNYGGYFNFTSSSVNSSLSYVSLDSLGSNTGYSITASRSFSLTNSLIKNTSSSYSIYLTSDTISPVIQTCTFSGNEASRTVFAPAASVSNITNNTNATISLYGSVNQNSQLQKAGLNSYFRIGNNVTINPGKTLTIQPGCKVSMPYSGYFTVNGTLIANGTASDSIYFYGQKQSIYNYGGFFNFTSSSSNSSLNYISIDSLGSNTGYSITASRSFLLTNSTIKNTSSSYSIYLTADTISPVIQNCTFIGDEASRTIYSNLGSVSNITNNTNVITSLYGSLIQNSQWQKAGFNSYYKLGSNVTIDVSKTLIIRPGCKVNMPYSSYLTVNGTLIANGTATDSIYFYGQKQSVYNYGGYFNFSSLSSNSSFNYVSLDSLGYNTGYSITASRSFSLTNSLIKNTSSSYSIYLTSDTISPIIQNCTFSGNEASRTVYASASSFSNLANNINAILKPTGSINSNAVWPKQGFNSYYQIDGTVTVNAGNVLTIEPGNIVNFPSASSALFVNGTLRAQGTETAAIQFLKIAGTGSATHGGGVFLNSGSSNHVLNYCTLDKLGGYSGYALGVLTSNASISNLSVSNSYSYGVWIQGASPTITSANITGNPYGVYSASGNPVFNNCNIFANTSYGVFNGSNVSTDTVDARNCYWGHPSGPKHTILNPLGLGNQVSNKVKFNPWKAQPANGQIVDMGVNAIIKPVTGCNLTSADTVRVKLTNYGNITQAGFPVSYRINSGIVVTETVVASLLPGTSQEYTFTQKANLSTPGTYAMKVYTTVTSDSIPANDTAALSIQHLAGVTAPANLLPANNITNVNLPVTLNWSAVPDVESYDLYIWKSTLAVPATPTVAGLTQISYAVSTNLLLYETAYNWKVVSKRSNCRAESAVQTFITRQLPDLVMESVTVPPAATSETDVTINWKVKNIGSGATGSTQWYDVVYISNQPVLGTGTDVYIGQYINFSALNAGESYTSANLIYHVPQGWQGSYYVIVKANYSNTLTEVADTNNRRTSMPVNISLAPPPDLQVTSLVVNPSTVFSEDSVTVSFTVQNLGTGPTTTQDWEDDVFLTKDTSLNTNTATYLFYVLHSQPLPVNGTYTVTKKVKLPAQISGTYYVHVVTDRYNRVFEYIREDNNTRRSLPMNIILRPAPNLVVSNLSVSGDTVSGTQPLNLQWTTQNDGAATAKPSWYEAIYYSTTATFNAATAIQLSGINRTDSIASLSSIAGQATIQLPAGLAEGSYYFYVKTDAYNQVFESTGENDNISAATGPVNIIRPDLKPVTLTTPATATSEQTVTVSWVVMNNSNALISNASWYDGIYLSTDTILSNNDIALGNQLINQLLPADAVYNRQANVVLPQGISGNYYFLMMTDVGNYVYEKSETNNLIYQPVTITMAPWPDLQVSSVTVPATDTVGSALQFQYTVQNSGVGAIPHKNWTDYVYLSLSNNVNTGSFTLIGTILQSRSLNSGSSYTQAASFTIPTSLSAGTYYVIIGTDATSQVYENTGENNNKTISTGIALASVPPIDLSVTAGQLLSNNVTAGQTASLQYTVKNNSTNATVISSWQDAVYLSNNPVLDAGDVLLSNFVVSGPLIAGASYTQTRNVIIPNGASGTLYLLVNTDKDNVHTDPNRGNNTLSINNGSGGQTIAITVPPPADLIIPAVSAPATATAAQPLTISFTVKNTGTGTTPASSWTDNVYLSTDYQLDYTDVAIGSFARNGILASGSQYLGTIETTIPSGLTGNYILIVKTDGSNNVYEPNEGNNLSFSAIYVAAQLPSDLIVIRMTALPVLAYIGAPNGFSWKLKNIGSNTASGYIKEALYLSKDTAFDAADILMGTTDGYISLPPQADTTRYISVQMRGVLPGYYHLLVKTDILNNIVEQNDSNNTHVSADTVLLSIREIPIDTVQYNILRNNLANYYRIEVPAGLVGETMSIKLNGDSTQNAINRLFVRYANVPAANQYDFIADVPFKANQEAIIPSLQAGTYYVMVMGTNTTTADQTISILPKIVPFAISAVDANKGGNTGAVTLKITGAKFDPATTFSLKKGITTITPVQVYYINQTQVFATYNLQNASLGFYNIVAEKSGGNTTILTNGFEIVQGPGSTIGTGSGTPGSGTGFVCQIINIGFEDQLQTDVFAPSGVRRNSVSTIDIQFENTGSVDIPVPVRYLLSLTDDVYIGFSPADFPQKLKDLKLECREAGGPPDVLRPGAKGFFKIYINVPALRGIGTIDFMISE